MSTQHPITPPPELVEQWRFGYVNRYHLFIDVAKEIAQWGADQELEACIDWASNARNHGLGWDLAAILSGKLRAARRPKPPSLKEQALEALERMQDQYPHLGNTKTIRRALNELPDN